MLGAYLRAVSQSARPLAGDGPLVVAGHLVAEAAGGADVLVRAHLQRAGVEDLVVVRVEQQVPHAGAPLVPGGDALEGVVEGHRHVAVLQVAPAVHVELAHDVHVEGGAEGLVEELDGGDVGVVGEVVSELVEGFDGDVDRVALGPFGGALQLAGVVKAVLGSGSAVQVEHDLDAVVAGPADCFADVVVGAVHEGGAVAADDGPVSDRETDHVQTNGCDLREVVLRDPCVPMVAETLGVPAILLAVGVLCEKS